MYVYIYYGRYTSDIYIYIRTDVLWQIYYGRYMKADIFRNIYIYIYIHICWRHLLQTLQQELWACTDLHGLAQFGASLARRCTDWMAPLARSCTDLHGSEDAQTCTETCKWILQCMDLHRCAQLHFSIHGFAHLCTRKLPDIYIYICVCKKHIDMYIYTYSLH